MDVVSLADRAVGP